MVTPENTMSIAGQQTLRDMVELQMYLVAQSQTALWPMLPRRIKGLPGGKKPCSNPAGSSAGRELLDLGFIEGTSRQTFVVSKSGFEFYEREMKGRIPVATK